MNYLSKVSLDRGLRRSYTIKIAIVGTISLLGLVLGIYSAITAKYLFSLWYFVAFVLGASYVIIRVNTAYPTYIATDGEKLVMSVWKNGIMPYTLPEHPNFISDFIPDKVKSYEIPVNEVESIYIGSKKFLKRSLSEQDYPEPLSRIEGDKHLDKVTKRMDFIYIRLKDESFRFMSVTGFDTQSLAELIDVIEKNCVGVQVYTNLPKLVRLRNKISNN